jgi:hypothetical protein
MAQVCGVNVIETGAKISVALYSAHKPAVYSAQLHFILKVRVTCPYLQGQPRSKEAYSVVSSQSACGQSTKECSK